MVTDWRIVLGYRHCYGKTIPLVSVLMFVRTVNWCWLCSRFSFLNCVTSSSFFCRPFVFGMLRLSFPCSGHDDRRHSRTREEEATRPRSEHRSYLFTRRRERKRGVAALFLFAHWVGRQTSCPAARWRMTSPLLLIIIA